MATLWETAASVWLEDEHSGQFVLAHSAGLGRIDAPALAHGRAADAARLLGASLPLSCSCSAIFPEAFAFCPECGRALASHAGLVKRQADWWGPHADPFLPRHVAQGLPVTMHALEGRLQGRPDCSLPVPPNAHCVFAAGHFGFPVQRLLALAPGRGVLQYWDPFGAQWQILRPDEGAASLRFSRSDYAWLPAANPARGEVAIVPGAAGLLRLWANPINESHRTETLCASAPLAAPGSVRRHLACLLEGPVLWSAPQDDLRQADTQALAVPSAAWSRPYSYDERLFWLHAEGELSWQPGSPAQWLPWPAPWTPRLELGGPVQSRDGRLWLIGHDGDAYSFRELGVADAEQHQVDGARAGFAQLLFRRGHLVAGEPWNMAQVEDQGDEDKLVLPLLRAFSSQRSQAQGLVLRLHQHNGSAEDALSGRQVGRTSIEWIGRRNQVLDELARLERPQDCLPLIYDGALYLHHPSWNALRGWRLKEAP